MFSKPSQIPKSWGLDIGLMVHADTLAISSFLWVRLKFEMKNTQLGPAGNE